MRLFFFSLVSILLPGLLQAQDFEKKFAQLFKDRDTLGQRQLLEKWNAKQPSNPELFVCYFNYYVTISKEEVLQLGKEPASKEYLEILDTGTQEVAGYLSSTMGYDAKLLQKGIDWIDRGITLHQSRLDMRFGKIYMLGEAGEYEQFTSSIIEVIEYGNTINNLWLWKENKKLDNPEEFFTGSIQDYINTLYNTGDDNLLANIRNISLALLRYHPTHVESLTNVALTYVVAGENEKGLPYLLKAEKVNPMDMIVIGNIAEVYKRLNDKSNAKIYYEKMLNNGNEDEKLMAAQQLQKL